VSRALPKRCVYAAPEAVVNSLDYAHRLVDEAGMDCILLRTGFNPADHDVSLGRAVALVKSLGIECWLLVGAWWGHGFDVGEEAMVGIADDMVAGGYDSHESQWRMASPGGRADDIIEGSLRHLSRRYGPDGFCLTHARYRHAAAIAGLFEVGGDAFRALMRERGLSQQELRRALELANVTLKTMGPGDLTSRAGIGGLAPFLDSLAETEVFTRWFSLRAAIVTRSVVRFRDAVKAELPTARFGTNAVGPIGAFESGQEYAALTEYCDVVQPLLGYVYWHVLQSVSAWQRFLADRVRGISRDDALGVAAALFGLTDVSLDLDRRDEGNDMSTAPRLVDEVVRRQLQLLEAYRDRRRLFMPVLNASHWQRATVNAITDKIVDSGYAGVAYQGTGALADPVDGNGWN